MLLIDDILLFPVHAVTWITREIHDAAQQEVANEGDTIRTELSELYMMLETGRISEEEFSAQEARLLDRLDLLDQQSHSIEEEPSEEESSEEESSEEESSEEELETPEEGPREEEPEILPGGQGS